MTAAPRYRLGLTEPLFVISEPLRDYRSLFTGNPLVGHRHITKPPTDARGLTERELDHLAGDLRAVEPGLRQYDAEIAPLIAAAARLPNPWWSQMRAALLARGEDERELDEAWFDEKRGSCLGAEFEFGNEPWFPVLYDEVAQRVDPAPFAAELTPLIARASALDVEKLVTALQRLLGFHPYGEPHQTQFENFHEAGEGTLRIGEVPTNEPEEWQWLSVYEGLLSWIGETAEVLQDRTGALLSTQRYVIDSLYSEVKALAGREGAHGALPTVAGQLLMLSRLLRGLCEEINEVRREMINDLGKILGCYNGRWREPEWKEGGVNLRSYLRIGIDPIVVP